MPIPTPVAQTVRGFLMGTADIVPGVSGGTVALVLGIYERLIHNIHTGAQALKGAATRDWTSFKSKLRQVEWVWLLSLLAGVLLAVAALSSILETLLHDHPIRMAALFFGLVVGSLTIAWRLIRTVGATELATIAVVAIALFLLLGLKSDTEVADGAAEVVTQPWWVFFLSGALAICAMILPGISGSFILVLIGMYTEVLGAVNDRDVAALASLMAGCVVGLALFSTLLTWALENYHDVVIASMVGLMLGSLRVLWPWPGGTNTTDLAAPSGDVWVPILIAVLGVAVVVVVEMIAVRTNHDPADTST